MAGLNFTYPHAMHRLGEGALNLASLDLRAALLLTNTTAFDDDANRDATSLSAFSVLDEHSTAAREILQNLDWSKDAAANRSELTADPTVWTAVAPDVSGRQIAGILVYVHVTDDTDSFPFQAFREGGFPNTPNGGDRTAIWDPGDGFFNLRSFE